MAAHIISITSPLPIHQAHTLLSKRTTKTFSKTPVTFKQRDYASETEEFEEIWENVQNTGRLISEALMVPTGAIIAQMDFSNNARTRANYSAARLGLLPTSTPTWVEGNRKGSRIQDCVQHRSMGDENAESDLSCLFIEVRIEEETTWRW